MAENGVAAANRCLSILDVFAEREFENARDLTRIFGGSVDICYVLERQGAGALATVATVPATGGP